MFYFCVLNSILEILFKEVIFLKKNRDYIKYYLNKHKYKKRLV